LHRAADSGSNDDVVSSLLALTYCFSKEKEGKNLLLNIFFFSVILYTIIGRNNK